MESIFINIPITVNIIIVNIPGINFANDLETAGGTPSGIFIVNFFTLDNLTNISVDNNPINIEENKAAVPK